MYNLRFQTLPMGYYCLILTRLPLHYVTCISIQCRCFSRRFSSQASSGVSHWMGLDWGWVADFDIRAYVGAGWSWLVWRYAWASMSYTRMSIFLGFKTPGLTSIPQPTSRCVPVRYRATLGILNPNTPKCYLGHAHAVNSDVP